MSEAKFVVGQWVTRKSRLWKVKEVDEDENSLVLEGFGSSYSDVCFPFAWQVGKTYKTTLDGLTATINETDDDGDVRAIIPGVPALRYWDQKTGRCKRWETDETKPHLLHYLADEPLPVAEAATFSESEDADECDSPDPLKELLAEFSHRREQCQRMAESWDTKAAEWITAEKLIQDAIERAKR